MEIKYVKYGVQMHDKLLYFDNYVVCNSKSEVLKIVTSLSPLRPIHKQDKLIAPLSQKSRTRTQSEVTLPRSQQACGEKGEGEATMGRLIQETYHIFLNLPYSHVHHPFGIRN